MASRLKIKRRNRIKEDEEKAAAKLLEKAIVTPEEAPVEPPVEVEEVPETPVEEKPVEKLTEPPKKTKKRKTAVKSEESE